MRNYYPDNNLSEEEYLNSYKDFISEFEEKPIRIHQFIVVDENNHIKIISHIVDLLNHSLHQNIDEIKKTCEDCHFKLPYLSNKTYSMSYIEDLLRKDGVAEPYEKDSLGQTNLFGYKIPETVSKIEKDDIYKYSKTHWISCKDYMPEDVLEHIVDEEWNTPMKYSDGSVDEHRNTIWKTKPHHDLHYLTPPVLIYRYNKYSIDFRRKFDSSDHYIWNNLEGIIDDYNFYWMQLPEVSSSMQEKIDKSLEEVNKLSYSESIKKHDEFLKTLKTRDDK